MEQTITKENPKDFQTSNIVVSDEEIERVVLNFVGKQFNKDFDAYDVAKETAKLIK